MHEVERGDGVRTAEPVEGGQRLVRAEATREVEAGALGCGDRDTGQRRDVLTGQVALAAADLPAGHSLVPTDDVRLQARARLQLTGTKHVDAPQPGSGTVDDDGVVAENEPGRLRPRRQRVWDG